jgi:hypothetical protein
MGIKEANLILAKVGESVERDVDGRARALHALMSQLRTAAHETKLKVQVQGALLRLHAGADRHIDLLCDDVHGHFVCGGVPLKLEYDPVARTFVGKDGKGDSAVELLAELVAARLRNQ